MGGSAKSGTNERRTRFETPGVGVGLVELADPDDDGVGAALEGAAVGLSAEGFPGTAHAPSPATRDAPRNPSAVRRLVVEG
ncbi:hypothetical protein [Arthrobacter sp. NA-172]|uniref:hypothetical protein n=1 Tax=Arthrobacter sp. NA-172 TaxID=3367524 RepID=UPI0037542710